MLTDDARALLEGGGALIIGLTKPDSRPFATRGWGLDVDDADEGARLLIRTADAATFGLQSGDAPAIPIAITAADVRSLASVLLSPDGAPTDSPLATGCILISSGIISAPVRTLSTAKPIPLRGGPAFAWLR